MSVRVEKCTVCITGRELKQVDALVKNAVAVAVGEFTDEPMPNGDMSREQYLAERRKRGFIRVQPVGTGGVAFEVDVRGNRESCKYELV